MKQDTIYLLHMKECLRHIALCKKAGSVDLEGYNPIDDALLRNLHMLAESAQQLSAKVKAQYPEIPWKRIVKFRHVVVHDYMTIDMGYDTTYP